MKTKEELKVELLVLQRNLRRAENALSQPDNSSETYPQPTASEIQAQQALVTFLLDNWDIKCLEDEGQGNPYQTATV